MGYREMNLELPDFHSNLKDELHKFAVEVVRPAALELDKLPPGKVIGPNELWMGSPAKLVRVMPAEERARFDRTAPAYVALAKRHRASLAAT